MRKAFEKLAQRVDQASDGSISRITKHFDGDNQDPHGQQPMNAFPGNASSSSSHPGGLPDIGAMHSNRKAVYPQPGQRAPGPGHLPPKVASTKYHQSMRFFHPRGHEHTVARDLGFTGVLDGKCVWTWGDTLMGGGSSAFICATDSTSIANLATPMHAVDTALWPNTDNIANWIDCLPHEEADGGLSCYAFGGTNIIEWAPNKGLVFFLKNHRPGGNGEIKGAGVATCEMLHGAVPKSHRTCDTMWNGFEPYYGDVGIAFNAAEGKVYAYGKGPGGDDEASKRTYLCRAPAERALDVNAYEYWDASKQTWGTARLANGEFGTAKLTNDQAIFGWMGMNQSAPFWSNYYNKWMFLYGDSWGYSDVLVMTADRLEGPWDNHGGMKVASTLPEGEGEGFRYCVCGHPEFDDTGKTVLVTWTRNNIIYGTTITWE